MAVDVEDALPVVPRLEPVTLGVDRTDRGARDWLQRFTRALAAEPETFHTSPDRAHELLELAESYADLYARANDDDTRTAGTIAQKNITKKAVLKAIVAHAHMIKADFHIPAEPKLRLGMKRA